MLTSLRSGQTQQEVASSTLSFSLSYRRFPKASSRGYHHHCHRPSVVQSLQCHLATEQERKRTSARKISLFLAHPRARFVIRGRRSLRPHLYTDWFLFPLFGPFYFLLRSRDAISSGLAGVGWLACGGLAGAKGSVHQRQWGGNEYKNLRREISYPAGQCPAIRLNYNQVTNWHLSKFILLLNRNDTHAAFRTPMPSTSHSDRQ